MERLRSKRLRILEAEAIHIIRETAASFKRPVMMFSSGKDSMVTLNLIQKAFAPCPVPFPLLHINTTWEFRELTAFRDQIVGAYDLTLHEWINRDGLRRGIHPIHSGTRRYAQTMSTEALRQAIDHYAFDALIGGARRDEERSRAKERVFSHRDKHHQWDAKNQRPELWQLYNGALHAGEEMRVFPLSNWTELDVWTYAYVENVPVAPLYFAKPRMVVARHGSLIAVEDERLELSPHEAPREEMVRFRTLGCYPLSGAIKSQAATIPEIIEETLRSRMSERQGRVIDFDDGGSMEEKKREGYF